MELSVPKRVLCRASQIAANAVVRVDLPDGAAIAVYNLEGDYFATDLLCTHGDASLAEGFVEDGKIICPFHGGAFDIRSGEPTSAPCILPLRTYPVRVEDDAIVAEIE